MVKVARIKKKPSKLGNGKKRGGGINPDKSTNATCLIRKLLRDSTWNTGPLPKWRSGHRAARSGPLGKVTVLSL